MSTLLDMALFLESMLRPNAADTTSDHNRLVVSPELSGVRSRLVSEQSPESASQCRATEFVVEAGRANGGFQHDIETGSVVRGASNVQFPRPLVARNQEIRDPETSKSGLGGRTSSNSTFITNLTTATSCSTWEGGDGCWVVVGFNLDERLNNLASKLPASGRIVWSPVVTLVTGKATSEC